MAMFMPSESHSGGVIVNPYIDNIAQELQFLMEKTGEQNINPIFTLDCERQPSKKRRPF